MHSIVFTNHLFGEFNRKSLKYPKNILTPARAFHFEISGPKMAKPLTKMISQHPGLWPSILTSPSLKEWRNLGGMGVPPQAFTNSPRLFPVGCKGAHNLEVFCAIKLYKWCIYQVGQKGDRNTCGYSLLLPNTNCLAPKWNLSAILSYLLAPSFAHQHLLWWHPWVHTGMLSLEEEHRPFDMKA